MIRLALCMTLVAFASVGCNEQLTMPGSPGQTLKTPPQGCIPATTMASHLGLQMVNTSGASAVMKNSSNIVILYADPNGQAYVNCRAVGPRNGFVVVGNTLYVPPGLEQVVRANLRPGEITRITTDVIQRDPPRPPANGKLGRVVIDAGHGGKDSGTEAAGKGSPEKNLNLAMALLVADDLRRAGAEVVMTRDDDTFIELDERVRIANQRGVRAFIALHADSSADRTDVGHTVIMPAASSAEAARLANAISKCMESAGSPVHAVRRDVRGLRVLEKTTVPAVIVEMGFLSNRSETAKLLSRDYERQLAQGIADGIADYLRK